MIDIEEDISEIVAHVARIDRSRVTRDSNLQELGLQSLDVVEIVFAIEDKFDVTVSYNANEAGVVDGGAFRTVANVIDAVTKLIAERGPQATTGTAAQSAA
jgi:acyl carrier protein